MGRKWTTALRAWKEGDIVELQNLGRERSCQAR